MKKTTLVFLYLLLMSFNVFSSQGNILNDGIYDITITVGKDSPQLITIEKVKVDGIVEINGKEFLTGEKFYFARPTTASENTKVIVEWDKVCFFITSDKSSKRKNSNIKQAHF